MNDNSVKESKKALTGYKLNAAGVLVVKSGHLKSTKLVRNLKSSYTVDRSSGKIKACG